MKRYGMLVVMLLLTLGAASGQQGQPRTARSTTIPQMTSSGSSYDPMAHGKGTGQPKGIVETTLAGLNPQNKDYGAVFADWRKEVFETTVNSIYLWSIFVLCLALSASLFGNGWLLRERQRRLTISANIVVQLFNAYVGSRVKSLEVIGKYNALVERYNRLNDEHSVLALQLARQKAEEAGPQIDYDRAKQDKGVLQKTPVDEPVLPLDGDRDEDADLPNIEMLLAQLKDFETKLQRKDAQLQAKENQITNLRSRLTRAHDSLEGERQQKLGMK
jgi:hypothetical protein